MPESTDASAPLDPPDSLDALGLLTHRHVSVTADLHHHELYTYDGLLTWLWHGPATATDVVLMCGGAMGGLLGPGHGLYHDLGTRLATKATGAIRVSYRRPNDLGPCVQDTVAAAEAARRHGARRFVVLGHSFGGAVAIQTAVALGERCVGVATFATQSAGCEPGEVLALRGVPILLIHGDRDAILPYYASQMVQMIVGGELVVIPGGDHILADAHDELRRRLLDWIPDRFSGR